jgi:hypothetical protein
MPVVFGPFLRQVAERAPVPVPARRNPDADDASDADTASVNPADTGGSGARRLALAAMASAVALAVGGWLTRRRGGDDASADD